MLETLTLETFAPHLGETFRIPLPDGQAIELELIDARSLVDPYAGRSGPRPARAPFGLVFKGPAAAPALSQQIYPLEHAALGRHELFVVPIGPDQGRMRYEVIFT
jgi:hypothetical protein